MKINFKQTKKTTAVLLIIALLFGTFAQDAYAYDGVKGSEISAEITDDYSDADVVDASGNYLYDLSSSSLPDVSEDEQADNPGGEQADISGEEVGDDITQNDIPDVTPGDISSGDSFDVSENDISDNDSGSDASRIFNACNAFRDILARETLMAVVYSDSATVYGGTGMDASAIMSLPLGTTVYVEDIDIDSNYDVRYGVYFYCNQSEKHGFISAKDLIYTDEDWKEWISTSYNELLIGAGIETINSIDDFFIESVYDDVNRFPVSYRDGLDALKKIHPNWIFVPVDTGLVFDTAVSIEADVAGNRSWIQATTFNSSNGFVGAPAAQSGWYYATPAGVSYYMDPRNFLTEDRIFMFEQLTYNKTYHTEAAVSAVLSGTFMKGDIPGEGMSYAKAFYNIGVSRNLSPVHLASRVYQEQGKGTSALISGKYPGYEGYYNYFNVGANGSDPVLKGLKYAKDAGWNTRYKSLEGGANTIGNGYILKGQDTIYYQKYNVSPYSQTTKYGHQYMQNVQAPSTEGYKTYTSYKNAGSLNAPFLFTIPVYRNMPGEVVQISSVKITGSTAKLRMPGRIDADTTGYSAADLAANVSSVQLKAALLPENHSESESDEVLWTSSDPSIATVDQTGLVTSVAPGTVTITAEAVGSSKYPKPKATYKITVFIPMEDVSFGEVDIALRRKDTVTTDTETLSPEDVSANRNTVIMELVKYPEDTTDKPSVVWKSSNTKVATVDSAGKVTSVGVGSAVITATVTGSIAAKKRVISTTVNVIAPVYSLTISNPTNRNTLLRGESLSMVSVVLPADPTGDKDVVWWSSDESVLTVDEKGLVKTVGVGSATVYAQSFKYTRGVDFTVSDSVLKFYDVSGQDVIKQCDVSFGEAIPGEIYTQMYDYYNELAGEDEFFAGFFTKPFGEGLQFGSDRAVEGGEVSLYPCYQATDCDFYIKPLGDFQYTGSAIKPVVLVYGKEAYENESGETEYRFVELTLNKEYSVSYANNTAVNTNPKKRPTVTVTGKGNFSGKKSVYFNILPVELNGSTVTADDITVAYTGRAIKSVITVWRNGKKLRNGTDYTLSYPSTQSGAYVKPGDWPVLIKGKGAYTGSITAVETITKDVFMSKVTISAIKNQTFDISGNTPALTVKYGKTPLIEGVHYVTTYTGNDKIGTAKATITAIEGSGYYGSKTVSFKIIGTSISSIKITDVSGNNGIKAKVYTGSVDDVLQTGYIVKFPYKEKNEAGKYVTKERILTEGVDYTVKYVGTEKAGTAKIVFTGINSYFGTVTKSYKILPRRISDAYTPASDLSVRYVKGGVKPEITVTDGEDKILVKNKDYTISYAYNTAITTDLTKKYPSYTIKGKGNYTGSVTGYFNIIDGDFADEGKITITASDVAYQKRAGVFQAAPVIKDQSGKALTKNTDYVIVSYTYVDDVSVNDTRGNVVVRSAGDTVDNKKDVVPAGTRIKVTVRGIKNYAGDGEVYRSVVYRVYSAKLTGVSLKVLNKKVYDYGKPVTISGADLKLVYKGTELVEGVDYYIDESTYKKNTAKGTATVVIRAVEDNPSFGGSRTVSFQIVPRTFLWTSN